MDKKIYKLTVRLNEKDYRDLRIQSKLLEKNKTEVIRELIRKGLYDDIKDFNYNFKEMLIIKRSISNSLNQIAKKINCSSLDNFRSIERDLEYLWQSLNR